MQSLRPALPVHRQLYAQAPHRSDQTLSYTRASGIRVWYGTWLTGASATDLSAAVDVYGEWVDAAEEVAKDGGSATVRDYAEASRGSRKDRDIANNSDDGHQQYSGDGIVPDDEY